MEFEIDYKKIGKRICTERKKQKISQAKLAELANFSDSYISRIETGKKN